MNLCNIANQLKGFLEAFQTDKSMVPFFEASLVDIFHTLMKIIVKAEVLDEICVDNVSSFKLFKIDLVKSENLVHHEWVKLPTATKALLKSLALPFDEKCWFLKECKANLVALIKKLQKECPVNYLICWNSLSLCPLLMVNSTMRSFAKFSCLVDKMYKLKWFSSKDYDCTKKQYDASIQSSSSEWKNKFLQFKIANDRINSLIAEFMDSN